MSTYTYLGAGTTDKDTVRFLLQDTDPFNANEWQVSDEDIQWAYETWYPLYHSLQYVAASIADTIAARYAREASYSADGVSVSSGSVGDQYRALAANLRQQYQAQLVGTIPSAGGIEPNEPLEPNTKPFAFGKGMHDNLEVGAQDYGGVYPPDIPVTGNMNVPDSREDRRAVRSRVRGGALRQELHQDGSEAGWGAEVGRPGQGHHDGRQAPSPRRDPAPGGWSRRADAGLDVARVPPVDGPAGSSGVSSAHHRSGQRQQAEAVPAMSTTPTSSPISAYSRQWVRSRATAVMEYTCRIERSGVPEGYDEDTLIYTAEGVATVIYEGTCRIWEVANASSVVVGDTDVYQMTTNLSIPWDTPEEIKRYDQVTILTSHTDDQMVGKRYEIQTVAKAGELRATRRFEVTGLM